MITGHSFSHFLPSLVSDILVYMLVCHISGYKILFAIFLNFVSNAPTVNLDKKKERKSYCICINSSISNMGNRNEEKVTIIQMIHTTNRVLKASLLNLNLSRPACMSHGEHHICKSETSLFLPVSEGWLWRFLVLLNFRFQNKQINNFTFVLHNQKYPRKHEVF